MMPCQTLFRKFTVDIGGSRELSRFSRFCVVDSRMSSVVSVEDVCGGMKYGSQSRLLKQGANDPAEC
jgi:hypothetical protein